MATIVVLATAAADVDDDDDDDDAKEDFLDNRPRRAKRTRAGRRSDFLKQECGAPLDADADTDDDDDDDDDDDTVVVVLRVVANLCIISLSLSLSLSFFYYCGDIFSFFFSLFALTFDQDEPEYEIPFCFPTKKRPKEQNKNPHYNLCVSSTRCFLLPPRRHRRRQNRLFDRRRCATIDRLKSVRRAST